MAITTQKTNMKTAAGDIGTALATIATAFSTFKSNLGTAARQVKTDQSLRRTGEFGAACGTKQLAEDVQALVVSLGLKELFYGFGGGNARPADSTSLTTKWNDRLSGW